MLLEHAHAMLLTSGLPKFLQTEMIQHATWIKNHTGTCALDGKTLYEMVFKSKHNIQDLPEWGSTIYILHKGCSKLKECTDQAHWVGYSSDSQGHWVYWPRKRHVTTKWKITSDYSTVIIQHRDVTEGGVDEWASSHTPNNAQLTGAPESSQHSQD